IPGGTWLRATDEGNATFATQILSGDRLIKGTIAKSDALVVSPQKSAAALALEALDHESARVRSVALTVLLSLEPGIRDGIEEALSARLVNWIVLRHWTDEDELLRVLNFLDSRERIWARASAARPSLLSVGLLTELSNVEFEEKTRVELSRL